MTYFVVYTNIVQRKHTHTRDRARTGFDERTTARTAVCGCPSANAGRPQFIAPTFERLMAFAFHFN